MYLNEKFMHYLVKSIICNDWIFLDDGAKFRIENEKRGGAILKDVQTRTNLKRRLGKTKYRRAGYSGLFLQGHVSSSGL